MLSSKTEKKNKTKQRKQKLMIITWLSNAHTHQPKAWWNRICGWLPYIILYIIVHHHHNHYGDHNIQTDRQTDNIKHTIIIMSAVCIEWGKNIHRSRIFWEKIVFFHLKKKRRRKFKIKSSIWLYFCCCCCWIFSYNNNNNKNVNPIIIGKICFFELQGKSKR